MKESYRITDLTDKEYEIVERLAGIGLTNSIIADYFGVHRVTFQSWLNKDDSLNIAIRKGKAKAISIATGGLFELIKSKNLGAICFYLKTQAGWSETVGENEDKERYLTPATLVKRIDENKPQAG